MRAAILIAVVLLGGCGSARVGEPLVAARPLSAEAQLGRVAFMRECHQCHPGGEAGLGPALNNKPLPGFLIRFQVRHGLGAMPSFDPDQVSDQELRQLVAYLGELRDRR